MKNSLRLCFTLALGLFTAAGLSAADHGSQHSGKLEKFPANPTAEQAAWLATEKAAYPLKTCVVSGDKLDGGDMGPPLDFIYREEGKPDRLIRFCCKDCIRDFNKDPHKYLTMLDESDAKEPAEPKGQSSHH
jgi:hypothetical protein